MRFAYANCMFWYLKKKNYDTKDISSIAGGIVELGKSSFEKYQKISLFMKQYKPNLKTKNNIDIDLMKCFCLDKDEEFKKFLISLE